MSNIKEFDCRPVSQEGAESPMAWTHQHHESRPAGPNPGVRIAEKAFLGHLILRGGAIVLDEAVRDVLGIALPGRPNTMTQNDAGTHSVQWLGPDEWLVIVPGGEEFELEAKLRKALGDAHFSIVNVSGGQTVLTLSGTNAREVLMKSVVYDVHPSAFPVGKGVTTVFAKATAIIRRPAEDHWELVVRRSFADYTYRWLLDAAAEYGVTQERA
ncbi:sarcosine oxidase subunit gamma [Larsenimonas suaedae]|uniref:Sarcosine oxidase subunit gamma family protein n=1 Tax=Larsenimonas suaedae TaxID=1851019 RepID=A0ABU1GVQ1_9GAMM|nr:sarcosine oxidase subunit gamma family protein [Larsenimonas suaedae]MCM2973229.1 sarcosine oxidase subunit gamma family protein [Larsenimonas suaedae]MDR5896122.1 sarcosine oxidase subunit gamma family protein [Larsenimonas suaedae]